VASFKLLSPSIKITDNAKPLTNLTLTLKQILFIIDDHFQKERNSVKVGCWVFFLIRLKVLHEYIILFEKDSVK
jgi:hypothetical protein